MKPTEIVAAALTAPDMAGSGERETRIEIPEAMLTARAMDAGLKRGIPIQTRMIARDMARKDAPEIPTGIQEATRTEPDTAANPKQVKPSEKALMDIYRRIQALEGITPAPASDIPT